MTRKALAKVSVTVNSIVQTKFDIRMFTTDLSVKLDDSVSPL